MDTIDTTPIRYETLQHKGVYCVSIHNSQTDYSVWHGYISRSSVLRLVGQYIIGHDFTKPRYHKSIRYGHLLITIENTTP